MNVISEQDKVKTDVKEYMKSQKNFKKQYKENVKNVVDIRSFNNFDTEAFEKEL